MKGNTAEENLLADNFSGLVQNMCKAVAYSNKCWATRLLCVIIYAQSIPLGVFILVTRNKGGLYE